MILTVSTSVLATRPRTVAAFGAAAQEGIEVFMADAARRPGAAHLAQIDTGIARAPPHRGRGDRLLAGRPRRSERRAA